MAIKSLKAMLVAPVLLGASIVLAAAPAQAEVSVADLVQDSNNQSQSAVTSVSQLSDVKPTDWAFQALQSLVERYGCIAGYPDKTYRGNRAMTRYEFAAGLNACMDRVNDLIAASTADMVKKEDLATLRKLQEQFAAELATLRGRVDGLESKVATLEKQQFSTTTKLRGEVIFALAGALGDTRATPNGLLRGPLEKNTAFSDRVRLVLSTSFTGKDSLYLRLQARNTAQFDGGSTSATAPRPNITGTSMSRLGFDGNNNNQVEVEKAYYRFPVGPNGRLTVDAIGGQLYANVENFNGQLASSGTGSISRFGRFNPIYRYGQGGTGATLNYSFGKNLGVSVAYLADNANNPVSGEGLFNGGTAILGQVEFKASNALMLGATYVRGYDNGNSGVTVSGSTGSALANRPFGSTATTSDNFGLQASFKFNPSLNLGGWVGYTSANREAAGGGNASIWNWAVNLTMPDLGKKGNLGGLIVGQQPTVTGRSVSGVGLGGEQSTNFFAEALYRYQINDKISVTPGLMVIFNPENNSANPTIYVGTIRTTFQF